MMKSYSPMVLTEIAAAGGGLVLDGARFRPTGLTKLVAAAKRHGATIVVRDAHRLGPSVMTEIAAAGPGCVIFDLTNAPEE